MNHGGVGRQGSPNQRSVRWIWRKKKRREYLYRVTNIPTTSIKNFQRKKMCKKWTSNLVDWIKFLTEEAKELNLPKTKLEDWLLKIYRPYSMTNPLLWFQKMNAYGKECFKTILILVQVKLPKNESTAYQESTFSVADNSMSNFQKNMISNLLERRTLTHWNCDLMNKHVFKN